MLQYSLSFTSRTVNIQFCKDSADKYISGGSKTRFCIIFMIRECAMLSQAKVEGRLKVGYVHRVFFGLLTLLLTPRCHDNHGQAAGVPCHNISKEKQNTYTSQD